MPDTQAEPCLSLEQVERYVATGGGDGAITSHLQRCEPCREQVATVRANNAMLARISAVIDQSGGRRAAPGRAEREPPEIPGYDVIRELHRGGQGIVLQAVQLATRRTVALKLLLAGSFATTKQRQRFEREIDLVATLRHPAIVTVYDSGVTDEGHHWFAMEYVDGVPLDQYMRSAGDSPLRRSGTLAELLRLLNGVCAGVSHAHQHGVIHRDLKPANIVVDANGHPHILDFGLAKGTHALSEVAAATVTVTGEFMGTLAYVSPEQCLGEPNAIDVRSDVYSLGVIAYELLSGTLPYSVNGPLPEVLQRIARWSPAAPSACRPARHRIDEELDAIVLKCLAKGRDRRYQSAEALRQDLERYLAGEPIEAKRDSGWYLLKKGLARHRFGAAAATLSVLLLAAVAVAMSVMYQRARIEAEKVKQINVFLEDTLGSVSVEPGHDVAVRDMLDEAVHWVELALSGQPEVQASVRMVIGNGYRNLGLHDLAEPQLAAAIETRQRLFGRDHLQVAQALNAMGLLRRDQGRFPEALQLMGEALRMRRERLGLDNLDVSMSLSNLASVKIRTGELDEAERLLRESLSIRRARLGAVHADVAMTLFTLANVETLRHDHEAAVQLHRQALAIRRRVLPSSHPDFMRSLAALADGLIRLDRHEEAEGLLIEHVQCAQAAWGEGSARTAEAVKSLVLFYEAMGRTNDAERYRARNAPRNVE